MDRLVNTVKTVALALGALTLGGCVSFGAAEPPESLLTLSSNAAVPPGTVREAGGEDKFGSVVILTPETPAKLNVTRIPVTVSETEIAYLQDAVWIDKPARLFRNLLGETLRPRTGALIVDSDDTPTAASVTVRGKLLDMGYDVASSSVLIRFEAIAVTADGRAVSRRFEAREAGVAPGAAAVGPALNRVANTVADQLADWLVSAPVVEPVEPNAPPIAAEPATEG